MLYSVAFVLFALNANNTSSISFLSMALPKSIVIVAVLLPHTVSITLFVSVDITPSVSVCGSLLPSSCSDSMSSTVTAAPLERLRVVPTYATSEPSSTSTSFVIPFDVRPL